MFTTHWVCIFVCPLEAVVNLLVSLLAQKLLVSWFRNWIFCDAYRLHMYKASLLWRGYQDYKLGNQAA
jgi:hypothetical protein